MENISSIQSLKMRNLGIGLTAELTKLMQTLKDQHDHRRKILGETFNPHNLVFCNSKGNIMILSELTRAFKRMLKAVNLPDIRFHDLRHSHATMLLKENVPSKVVSERLGHSKIQITLDTYSHVTDSIKASAVEHLNGLLD